MKTLKEKLKENRSKHDKGSGDSYWESVVEVIKKHYKDNIEHKTFIVTDGCMWEKNKKDGTSHPHAIEVVDTKTGAVRYIKSGSQIRFVGGEITPGRDQESYNKQA